MTSKNSNLSDSIFIQPLELKGYDFRMYVMDEILRIVPYDNNFPVEYDDVLNKEYTFDYPTEIMAIDCEMDGVPPPESDTVIRVSLINSNGGIVFDSLIYPEIAVTQSRTAIHGIKAKDYKNAPFFNEAEEILRKLCKGSLIIGHSVLTDL